LKELWRMQFILITDDKAGAEPLRHVFTNGVPQA
jgi:hypothetical protein